MKNNYWKQHVKNGLYYSAGKEGWQISVYVEEVKQYGGWHENLGRPVNDQGFVIDKKGNVVVHSKIVYDIPRGCNREARADFRKKMAMDKRIAQSVTTREEYNALWRRIDDEDWDYILEHDLKDGNLIYWAYNTRTADEYYRLLRYN
jgi:hypothetical protein